MSRLGCLLLVWAICEGVIAKEENQNGFVEPLDFSPIFDSGNTGVTSLASSPVSAAILKTNKSQYPHLFDTIVSSSIDSLQRRTAPQHNAFSSEHFGFNPIASQGFHPPAQSARLIRPQPQRHHQQQPHLTHLPIREHLSPVRYDIRQVHDADYKVYKPEENEQGEEILAALKQNPSVSSYFQPQVSNHEVAHPIKYRNEESDENADVDQNYNPNAYITGSSRIRRYAGGRRNAKLRKSSEEDEEEDPYNYKAEYVSRPKAFDDGAYSAYKEEKDPNKDYEYPYGYDSAYDHKEYDRIKDLSEKQAAEIRQNPGNCKEVLRDGMSCMVCKDPKTGGNYESCSYVTEPKNNKYAYSKEKKFDSNDEPNEPEKEGKSNEPQPKGLAKYEEAKDDSQEYSTPETEKSHDEYNKKGDDSDGKYKAFYTHSSQPKPSESLRAASDEDSSEEKSDTLAKPYNYKQALPGFYSDNEPKKDVEHVLAEFKKKDRSACKRVQKNGMTCFQCIDKAGLKNEECMFVSESAPVRSHLAYQEVKEFTSKPETVHTGHVGAESQTVTTSAPAVQRSAAYVVANNNYGKKLKRKKARPANLSTASKPVATAIPATHQLRKQHVVKRSTEEAETRAEIVDETNIAPPEDFAGDNSKGAFWAETRPRYSAALGVTLPEFMLAPSLHEVAFDEVVAGA